MDGPVGLEIGFCVDGLMHTDTCLLIVIITNNNVISITV